MKRRSGQSGQAATEFAIFTIMLVFMIMLIIQLMWIGVQKWQFNHIVAYSARRWTVYKNEGAQSSLTQVQLIGSIFGGWPLGENYVKFPIIVTSSSTSRNGVTGIVYQGLADPFPLYQGWIGDYLGFGVFLPFIRYETFIPMVKEPNENTSGHDNDCSDTPCSSGNGR